MEKVDPWKEAFCNSKPLITYAIISGLNMKTIATVFNQIRLGLDPAELHIEQTVLDRIPRIDRPDYEFPQTAPIFLEGYNIMKEPQSPKAFPIVLTSTEAGRRYGIALMFYEDLKDYIRVLQESLPSYIKEELEKEANNTPTEEISKDKLDEETEKMIKEEITKRGESGLEERSKSVKECEYQAIYPMLLNYGTEYMAVDGLFHGENYYIPKAIMLISEYPIFETLEQIIRHIYII